MHTFIVPFNISLDVSLAPVFYVVEPVSANVFHFLNFLSLFLLQMFDKDPVLI